MTDNPASKLARRIADEAARCNRYPEHAPALCAVCTIATIEREFGPICSVLDAIAGAAEYTCDIGQVIDAVFKQDAAEALAKLGEK